VWFFFVVVEIYVNLVVSSLLFYRLIDVYPQMVNQNSPKWQRVNTYEPLPKWQRVNTYEPLFYKISCETLKTHLDQVNICFISCKKEESKYKAK